MAISSIHVDFFEPVEITRDEEIKLQEIVTAICDRYKAKNLGRTMWLFGYGSRPLTNPFLVDDDHPMEFDDSELYLECFAREDFSWPCAKCGHEQGDHKGLILEPPAGDCDFEPVRERGES